MHNLILRFQKEWLASNPKGLLCCLLLSAVPCFGQPSSMAPQIMSAQQQVKWVNGPVKADLGATAEVEIPEGYRLTDAPGARVLLERMKNPVPSGLVGIMAPESGAWWVILEFSETGYVKPTTTKWISATAILTGMQNKIEPQNKLRLKQGAPPITAVNWDLAPEFDASNNSLTYAIQIEAGAEKIINQSVRLLGRNGVLVGTVVHKVSATSEKPALQELLKGVAFKTGQRYEDYQMGDKVANADLYQMITGDEQIPVSPKTGWAAFFDRKKMIWIVSGAAVCVLAWVVYLVTKEIRSLNPRNTPLPTLAARNGSVAKARSAKAFDSAGRRRAFDYQKFYADMMKQVSNRSYTGLVVNHRQRRAKETGSTVSPNSALPSVAEAQKGAASELIARQKDFIEEQRRLMQQQTKLIEERSKLIEEKNQLLAKQSEMIENHLL